MSVVNYFNLLASVSGNEQSAVLKVTFACGIMFIRKNAQQFLLRRRHIAQVLQHQFTTYSQVAIITTIKVLLNLTTKVLQYTWQYLGVAPGEESGVVD